MHRNMRKRLLELGCFLALTGAAVAEPKIDEAGVPFPPVRWTDEEAEAQGWKRADIDLGATSFNYETYLPEDASIRTAPLDGPNSEGFGHVSVVAKYALDFPYGAIDGTVTAFQLRDTGAANRLCKAFLSAKEYRTLIADTNRDQTHAQLLSATFDEKDRPQQGFFADCRTRGHDMIIHSFEFPLAPASEPADLNARVDAALDVALPIVSNLDFDDGRPDGYGDAATWIDVLIGDAPTKLPVPSPLKVVFNDFEKPGAARELYLLDQRDGGVRALVWLAVFDTPKGPIPLDAGVEMAQRQLMGQSEGLPRPKLQSREPINLSSDGTLKGEAFRFAVTNSKGEGAGTLKGKTFWNNGRLFVVSYYSNIAEEEGRPLSMIVTRLPGQSAYDLVQSAVLAEQ